jgi:hypothetical protein
MSSLASNKQEHKMEKHKIHNHKKKKKSILNQHGKNHTQKKIFKWKMDLFLTFKQIETF